MLFSGSTVHSWRKHGEFKGIGRVWEHTLTHRRNLGTCNKSTSSLVGSTWLEGYVQRVGLWTLGVECPGLHPDSAGPTWVLPSIKWPRGCRGQGLLGPILQAPVLTCGLWKFPSREHRLSNHHEKSTSRTGGIRGPYKDWPGLGCQAVPLLRPLHGCEHLPKPLPLKPESPQTERAGRSSWGYFTPSCILSACLQASAALGWRNPGRGSTLGPASFSRSVHWTSASSPTPLPPSPQQVAETFTFLSWGSQKAPRGAPLESFTPHLASALCPSPCPGSSLAEPLQI